VGKGKWFSSESPPVEPLRANWGRVRPWILERGDQLRPPPPPDIDSAEFREALEELRLYSRTRTPEQLRIALSWADGPGTSTPPGHWNQIAAGLIQERRLNEMEAARVMAFLNMALMDAGIACWDAKTTYWLIRPSQVDPTITLPVGLPNFPAYPSGHSTFSAAAAEVLAHFFPEEGERLRAMAEEASMSRLYGGIHYRFDAREGIELGRSIGRLASQREDEQRGQPAAQLSASQ
jgi:membrane-associated phospholipid phosphatase